MNLEEAKTVFYRLGSVSFKSTSRGFKTNCPLTHKHARGDQDPSLQVFDGDPTICYCFSCKWKGKLYYLAKESGKASSELLDYIDGAEGRDLMKRASNLPSYENIPSSSRYLSRADQIRSRAMMSSTCGIGGPNVTSDGSTGNVSDEEKAKLLGWVDYAYPAYLIKRGILQDTAKAWLVGFDAEGYMGIRTGQKNNWSTVRSQYHFSIGEGITFPVCREDGEIVGWSRRTIHSTKSKSTVKKWKDGLDLFVVRGSPKYYHKPGWKKDKYLYGMHKIDIQKSDIGIVTEGFFDVLNQYQHGIVNVLAGMGSDLSDVQLRFLIKKFKRIVLFPDGDKAGLESAIKVFHKLKDHVTVKICGWIDGKDPGDYDKVTSFELLKKIYMSSVKGVSREQGR